MNFFNLPNVAGSLRMDANSMPGLRIPTLPSTIAGDANLQAPTDAMSLGGSGGLNQMQMNNLVMRLLGGMNPQQEQQQMTMPAPAMGGMRQMPQMPAGMMAQYAPQALMQRQQTNDDMMRQRMQGLLALLGGQ